MEPGDPGNASFFDCVNYWQNPLITIVCDHLESLKKKTENYLTG